MDERHRDLARYRMEKAAICLDSAKLLVQAGDYCGAANRSYYAIFHSIRSILALEGVDFSKHSGVMSYFQKNYVKTGILGKEYSKILMEAFSIRSESDYDDYFVISKEDVEHQVCGADFFLNGVKRYLQSILSSFSEDRNMSAEERETNETKIQTSGLPDPGCPCGD